MQDKKSSLLKNIRNFNKKVLSGNQALHKNEVTAKKQKTMSIQFLLSLDLIWRKRVLSIKDTF